MYLMIMDKKQPCIFFYTGLYTIEFQKRGLPHAHILLFLESSTKNPSLDRIDKIIKTEISNQSIDLNGFNAITKFMIHGPCGDLYPSSPCMIQSKCSKHFLKKFVAHTTVDQDGFPIYRRRDTGAFVEKKNISWTIGMSYLITEISLLNMMLISM